jgi:hypothetical protein
VGGDRRITARRRPLAVVSFVGGVHDAIVSVTQVTKTLLYIGRTRRYMQGEPARVDVAVFRLEEDAMKSRSGFVLILAGAVTLLCGSHPAQSGVHLWRLTELFSNADGTIQFIEMTTCCGSAGGEIFVGGQHLTSNTGDFIFPGNLTMSTANKHLLLGTSGYASLPGAPVPDYIIPNHFFSTAGDTLSFAVYDTMIFGAGAMPTNGANSLQKNQDDATDTAFVAVNSPTNLHEQTGSVAAITGPPGVPDGSAGTTPLRVASLAADGASLRVSFDTASCASNVANHHIVYGQRAGFPAAPGGIYTPMGSVCAIGNASPYDWSGVPEPTDGSGLIWFIVVATDSAGVEGSWGVDSAHNERRGPGNNGASGTCAVVKDTTNACGHL